MEEVEMIKINWKLRLLSSKFWMSLVPALFLLAEAIGTPLGYKWDFIVLNQQISAIINAIFTVLTIVGVVTDPTTQGLGDSETAMKRKNMKEGK